MNTIPSKQRAQQIVARTNHVAQNRAAELHREAQQDTNAPEATVKGMRAALKKLLKGYRGARQ